MFSDLYNIKKSKGLYVSENLSEARMIEVRSMVLIWDWIVDNAEYIIVNVDKNNDIKQNKELLPAYKRAKARHKDEKN